MANYGKLFGSAFNGSLAGAGPTVIATWAYILATAGPSDEIDINPRLVAAVLGCSEEDVVAALKFLASPDPNSRSREHEGRRLLQTGVWRWKIVNHGKYWGQHVSNQKTATAEAVVKGTERFTPPTPTEVQEFLDSIGEKEFTGEQFVAFYEASGWKRGRAQTPIKNWKACVRTWQRKGKEEQQKSGWNRSRQRTAIEITGVDTVKAGHCVCCGTPSDWSFCPRCLADWRARYGE